MMQFLFLLTFIASSAFANQTQILKVRVYEKGKGSPLGRVEVKLNGKTSYTNPDGQVILDPSPIPQDTLSFYRAGYEEMKVDPSTLVGLQEADFYLLPEQPGDNVVNIEGEKRREVSKKVINIAEAKAVAPNGDPAQITKLLPGVRASLFQPQIVVRGSAPTDSKYYVDNFEVGFLFHPVGNLSVVPAPLLGNVQFVAGGFGADKGQATGGVVTLETKNEIPERREISATINVPFYSGIYYNQPISESETVSASVRQSTLKYIIQPLLKGSEVVVIPEFDDEHVRYFKKFEGGYFKSLFLRSSDGFKLYSKVSEGSSEDGAISLNISQNFMLGGAELQNQLTKDWTYTASPQVLHTEINNQINDIHIKIAGPTYIVPIELQQRVSPKEKLFVGAEWRRTTAAVDVYAPKVDRSDSFVSVEEAPLVASTVNYKADSYAGWITRDVALWDFILSPGIRGFYSGDIKKSGYDPRFSFLYTWAQDRRFKGAVGQYSLSPTNEKIDTQFGNPDLNFARSEHYILGWEENWGERWSTDFQVFYKIGKSVVVSDKLTNYSNKGSTKTYGFEAFVRRNLTERAFGWLAYTYSNAQVRDSDTDPWLASQYDQEHNLNVAGSYKFTGVWALSGRVNYHTGDRYTPVDSTVFNANIASYQPRYSPTGEYSARLPDYYQGDLYSSYDFLWDRWKLQLKGGLQYLSFTRPTYAVNYNFDYTKKTYSQGLPPIPYLELQGEF